MPFDGKLYDLVNSKADRLSYMADFLEGEPEEAVYMGGYYGWSSDEVDPRLPDCSTAACICGWAAVLPAFKFLGFGDPTYFHDAEQWGLTEHEATLTFMEQFYPNRRPDGEPFKADVVARLRHYADVVRARA